MKKDPIFQLCDIIRETAFALHRYHRHGHPEKIYENGLAHRLRKQGLKIQPQHPLHILDEVRTLLGKFFADLFAANKLIVKLKACRTLVNDHTAQLLGYLRSARCEHGLLINFGAPVLQIKKYALSDLSSS